MPVRWQKNSASCRVLDMTMTAMLNSGLGEKADMTEEGVQTLLTAARTLPPTYALLGLCLSPPIPNTKS